MRDRATSEKGKKADRNGLSVRLGALVVARIKFHFFPDVPVSLRDAARFQTADGRRGAEAFPPP